jgi:hypothetical protein
MIVAAAAAGWGGWGWGDVMEGDDSVVSDPVMITASEAGVGVGCTTVVGRLGMVEPLAPGVPGM